jgi:prolyl-tRNA editing enzyme YbaK/EbsC (Cys-tRNA(Pro) deacylase)
VIERKVTARLDELDISYERMPCDPRYADTAEFCEHYGIDPSISANAIVVASKRPAGRYAMCVALSTTRLDVNHRVRELMGVKKLSFASPEVTVDVTGMMIGGVTPFGAPDDLGVYVDERVMQCSEVIVGGGSRSWKIRVSPAAFELLPNTEIVRGLAGAR